MLYKLKIKQVLAFTLLIGLFGCSKELDQLPESAVSPDQISASNIAFFLNGLYRESLPARDNYVLNDTRGGNYTWTALSGSNSAYGMVITGNNVDDRLSYSSSIWNHAYSNIYNANIILDAADRLSAEADLSAVKAEASYLRAWLYYQLVTNFGGVPLILSNTTDNVPRNGADEIWTQILADIDYAAANGRPLGSTGAKKASKEAANALKARVLLAQGKKQQAATLAESVIDAAGLSIDADYGRIFRDTDASTEIIFAFGNLKTESNLRMSSLYWPYGTTWAGSYFVQPSDYVVDELYEEGDMRAEVNIQTIVNSDGSSNTIVSKYWDVQPLIVSRVSELYLIAAEGYGRTQGLPFLNAVRTKRGLPALTASDVASDEAYLTEVLEERRRELFSEGFLFQDLVRTDRAIQLPNISSKDKYLLPIPGAQVSLSGGVLEQNPSY